MDTPKEMKLCGNCKREIGEDTFLLHELHCKRKLVLCKVCNEPVPRADFEEHNQKEHGPVACDLCGTSVLQHNMEKHKDEDCPQVKKECKYCELDITRGTYDEHVEGCGSRTDFCELCNQRVMLRDMQEHLQNKCKMPSRGDDLRYPYATGPGLNDQDLVNTGILPPRHEFNMNDLMMHHHSGRRSPPPMSENRESQAAARNVHVDTQWLASVTEACGSDDDLDQVLAQNLRATEGRVGGLMHGKISSSSSDNDTMLDREGLTREQIERMEMEKERADEELALRLHAQENSYRPLEAAGDERPPHHVQAGYDSPPMASVSVLNQGKREPVMSSIGGPGSGIDLKREDSGGMSTEESDAEMARMIYERDLQYVKSNPGIKNSGRDHWVDPSNVGGWQRDRSGSDPHARRSPDNNGRANENHEIPRMTQFGEEASGGIGWNSDRDNMSGWQRERNGSDPRARRSPDNIGVGGANARRDRPRSPAVARNTDTNWSTNIDAKLALEIQQREKDYVESLRIDRELAEQMQQAEDRSGRADRNYEIGGTSQGGEVASGGIRRFEVTDQDRLVGERMQAIPRQPQRGEGDLAVARRLLNNDSSRHSHSSQESHSYNQELVMNEEPRPKPPMQLPVEATKDDATVPCQYCSELFPFSVIMDHQNVCSADAQVGMASMTSSIFPGIRQSREEREERVLSDEVLRQAEQEHEQHHNFYPGRESEKRSCKYCRDEMALGDLLSHEVMCPLNPDSRLNSVHRRLPHPPVHRETLPTLNTAQRRNSDDMGPCEKCEKLIPADALVRHETTCRGQANPYHSSHTPHSPQPTSNSHSKIKMGIRFPSQEGTPPPYTTATHSPTSSSAHVTAFPLHSPNSHSPFSSRQTRADRERPGKREEEMAQHSNPPLAVVGTSILGTTRSDSLGNSRRKRNEEDVETDVVHHRHQAGGTGGSHIVYKPPRATGGGRVNNPHSLGLERKPLHSDWQHSSSSRSNGFT